ncbi:uncharacterized protein LOC144658002 [Oculina patagonica]
MGCAFSSNRVRVPRIFKKRKVSRSQKYRLSASPSPPPKIEFNLTRDLNCEKPSERVATPNGSRAEWQMHKPDIAPSLLAWLMGPKDCLEDNIPELANANKHKETIANQQRKKDRDFVLPDCLSYNDMYYFKDNALQKQNACLSLTSSFIKRTAQLTSMIQITS